MKTFLLAAACLLAPRFVFANAEKTVHWTAVTIYGPKSDHSIRVDAKVKDEKPQVLALTLDGKTFTVPKQEFAGIENVHLDSINLREGEIDAERGKGRVPYRAVSLEFGGVIKSAHGNQSNSVEFMFYPDGFHGRIVRRATAPGEWSVMEKIAGKPESVQGAQLEFK